MKKILIIIIIVAMSGGIFWFLTSKNQGVNTPVTFQEGETPRTQQNASPVKDNEVSQDFKTQIQTNNSLILENPIISSEYALQNWSDENKGGQALLRYNPSQGWVLITMGGGVWSVIDLVDYGVPREVARRLVGDSQKIILKSG